MLNKTEYFNSLYSGNDDPWEYRSRWYEERKRQICLSLLHKNHYESALEIGCANGTFSELLAQKTNRLLCLDANQKAVDLAAQILDKFTHISVECKSVPVEFPDGNFDLIVLSEVAYYLTQHELDELILKLQKSLNDDGMLLSCHWRHPIEHFQLDGHRVHQQLKEKLNLFHYSSLIDPDFLVDIWTKDARSLAQLERII